MRTGGDPAKRPDVVEIVAEGARLGLRMGMTPSAIPLLTPAHRRRRRDRVERSGQEGGPKTT